MRYCQIRKRDRSMMDIGVDHTMRISTMKQTQIKMEKVNMKKVNRNRAEKLHSLAMSGTY
jgi:hypothetical protein